MLMLSCALQNGMRVKARSGNQNKKGGRQLEKLSILTENRKKANTCWRIIFLRPRTPVRMIKSSTFKNLYVNEPQFEYLQNTFVGGRVCDVYFIFWISKNTIISVARSYSIVWRDIWLYLFADPTSKSYHATFVPHLK